MKDDLILCSCCDMEHIMIWTYNEEEKEIYINVHLNNEYPWYVRIVHAIRYIFGHRSRYGDFGCFVVNSKYWKKFKKASYILKPNKDAEVPVSVSFIQKK